MGEEPGVTEATGNVMQAIIEVAEAKRSSLIVCGLRGIKGTGQRQRASRAPGRMRGAADPGR
jgi:hypothetical protein